MIIHIEDADILADHSGDWYEADGLEGQKIKVRHISSQHVRDSRWESWHLLVIEDSWGNLWGQEYAQGLTECQEYRGFEPASPDGTWVPFKPVVAKKRTIVEFEFEK